MQPRTESRVEGWDSRPFEGGYAGLQDLADRDFSGVVRASGTWLFMLNGRVVGVYQGSISDFEGADGTTFVAPDPSLPLLFSMQEQGGTVQAKYYTNDTPISEAVQTLTDSNFTGYIELSENVLSGDYYVVFYGGRSMSAAFVGNNETLLTGDEAFNRADDEVGIYEVMQVDVEVTDVPEPAGADTNGGTAMGEGMDGADDAAVGGMGTGAAGASGGADPEQGAASDPLASADTVEGDANADDPGGTSTEEGESGTADPSPPPDADPDPDRTADPTAEPGPATDSRAEPQTETTPVEPEALGPETDPDAAAASAAREAAANAASTTESSEPAPPSDPTGESVESQPTAENVESQPTAEGVESQSTAENVESQPTAKSATTAGADDQGGVAGAEREWQETRTIPSIDPTRSAGAGVGAESTAGSATGGGTAVGSSASERPSTEPAAGSTPAEPTGKSEPDSATGAGAAMAPDASDGGSAEQPPGTTDPVEEAVNSQRVEELERELEERAAQINRFERKLTDVQVERDSLAEERSRLTAEITQLEGEIEELEGRLAQLQESVDGEAAVGQQLDPETALEQTNLFVRYGTKSGGTLAKAHDGQVDADEVNNNLRLEHHTQFDEGQAGVDGRPFGDFLADTMEFRFVEWVVEHLLYEIRGTGHQKALKSLYDAIPQIDRAELKGSVSVRYTKDGEEYREQQRFDVVMRDRMGNPLIVVNLNDSRNPATEEMMVGMIEAAGKVKRTSEALSTAMLVTASFFEPQALEEADEATSGGFLGRDSRDSFVKLSRKQGYHLCLVESRGGDFHLTLPEL